MSWNEQGSGSKDPWGNRSNQNGPPDLDEVLKNLQAKIAGIFGGRGSGSGPSSSSGMTWMGLSLFVILALTLWVATGFYIIQPAERGVVTQFGRYTSTELPGWHWRIPWPVQSYERVNIDQNRSIRLRQQSMLTRDENIVEIDIAIQYNVKNPEKFLFEVRDPDGTLQEVAESSVREVIGNNEMDFIITEGRNTIALETKESMQRLLDEYGTGILVTAVNLESAQPPEAVQAAFSDAIKAREDEQRFINEAEAYSNEVIPQARGSARQLLEEAKAYRTRVVKSAEGETQRFLSLLNEYEKAPQVTRDRLYIDSIESVLSNTNKVVIDVEGGNNLMYLPLDKLINERGSRADSVNSSLDGSFSIPTPATPPTVNRRSRGSN